MAEDLVKKLLEAGVHFGHQTKRWNPKMKKFIFGERGGIYIIDLEKTVEYLNCAKDFLYGVASKGGKVLFVGTKKQAQDIVQSAAQETGMFFVRNRWFGGLLTNFQTVKRSLNRLSEIEKMTESGLLDQLPKKEIARLTKEKEKLVYDLGGIREMTALPQAIFIVDSRKEKIAVHEANRLNIPIVGLIDTNCDPEFIDFPIPGNDDALKSVRFISSLLVESIQEGKKEYLARETIRRKEESSQEPAVMSVETSSPKASREATTPRS
jgi:small subunit ribosomal protein S2